MEEDCDERSTWEERAEQLFSLCDREGKGFITKRDLQRLWGELPLGPDELEGVFDSLDQDHNGFLTLQEFTDGFGHHLGLVVEFRADCDSPRDSAGNEDNDGEEEPDGGVENEDGGGGGGGREGKRGSISLQQIDEILNAFAKHHFNISSSVVESVWHEVCQEEDEEGGSGLGRLVVALLQELSRAKTEHTQLEAALNSKTQQYNSQVAHLYEELESQLNGERSKVVAEHNEKGARALASLEEEVREKEQAYRVLQEDNAALVRKVESLTSAVSTGKQDNVRLTQNLSKLEEEFALKEKEAEELSTALDILRKSIKDEKRRRAQQALKVSEGIALERESLVTQLDLLRSMNTELRDEQDQNAQSPRGHLPDNRSSSTFEEETGDGTPRPGPPKPAKRSSSVTFDPAVEESTTTTTRERHRRRPSTLPLAALRNVNNRSVSIDASMSPTDLEHDEFYFENSTVATGEPDLLPDVESSPQEPSLLQELLQQPCHCMTSEEGISPAKTKAPFRRTDSVTQTSPTLSMTSLETLFDSLENTKREPSVQQNSQELSGNSSSSSSKQNSRESSEDASSSSSKQNSKESSGNSTTGAFSPAEKTLEPQQEQPAEEGANETKSCLKEPKIPGLTKTSRIENHDAPPTSILPSHSSTVIIRYPSEPLDIGIQPENHINKAYIHTQYRYQSHAYLPLKQLQSSSTNTVGYNSEKRDIKVINNFCQTVESDELVDSEHRPIDSNEHLAIRHFAEEIRCMVQDESSETNDSIQPLDILANERNPKENKFAVHPDGFVSHMNEQNLQNETIVALSQVNEDVKIADRSKMSAAKNRRKSDCHNAPGSPQINRIFKVVFIGDSGVGKTTFIHRVSSGEFRRDFATTVGVDYRVLETRVGDTRATLQLWDTAGQERYKAITRQYYRKADCVVVMYDITSEKSFLDVTDWISSVREYGDSNLAMAIIGNKQDMQKARQISFDTASDLAKAHDALMMEVSAATGFGATEAMSQIAALLAKDHLRNGANSASTTTLSLHQPPKSLSKCCS